MCMTMPTLAQGRSRWIHPWRKATLPALPVLAEHGWPLD